jgi:acetate---CoA ligase (ADP-forming) subunit beta
MVLQEQEGKRNILTEVESKDLLDKAGIPVVKASLAKNQKEAVEIARELGFPVAMKIISQNITHKSDIGGVKLGLADETQTEKAYAEIMASISQKAPGARITGVSIQKMARPGIELIVGLSRDPQFGPMIMFGLGGTLVEILKDVSFRLVPLARRDAAEMIKEIKGHAILQGYRGQEPVNIRALEDFILLVSEFIEKNPQIEELDLNPVFGYRDDVIAADARIVLKE